MHIQTYRTTFIHSFSACLCGCVALSTDPYLHLLENRMVLYPRKEDPHGVGAVVQERDSCSIQLLSEFMDVCLQLCKSCTKNKTMVKKYATKLVLL